MPSDFATFKTPTPSASCFRTFRSVALRYVSENLCPGDNISGPAPTKLARHITEA
jgi:hypothetical protein